MVNREQCEQLLESFNLSNEQYDKLYRYYELIHEYNKVLNLTGIDDIEGVYIKHFKDTFLLNNQIEQINPQTIGDVGTGMGVPGIVLAIKYPQTDFYLIEPLQKRCKFLNVVVEELNLDNVKILNKRVEDLNIKVDMIVSRAVAKMNILVEIGYGILKVNGYFLAQKSKKADDELIEAKNAFDKLGMELIEKKQIDLDDNLRVNVLLKKKKNNAKYPRHFSQIKKSPL